MSWWERKANEATIDRIGFARLSNRKTGVVFTNTTCRKDFTPPDRHDCKRATAQGSQGGTGPSVSSEGIPPTIFELARRDRYAGIAAALSVRCRASLQLMRALLHSERQEAVLVLAKWQPCSGKQFAQF
jgi:hypothetical protein